MRLLPYKTTNPNVPQGYLLIAETEGETFETYYADYRCDLFAVLNTEGSQPRRLTYPQAMMETGMSMSSIASRASHYYERD